LQLDRRRFLHLTGDLALLALAPGRVLAAVAEVASRAGTGVFLSAPQLRALGALCAYWVPGPPEDPDPGAAEAGVANYIDLLLGVFSLPSHPLFAGGPFSNRDGGGRDAFLDWLPLDALEQRVWRTRIEGSRGLPERQWNGPVVGWQEQYRQGLEALEVGARRLFGKPFAGLSRWQQGMALDFAPGGPERDFLDLAFRHTVEGMYGPPEYGGNRGRVGWRNTRWPGDHQPLGYTPAQLSKPDADQAEAVARAKTRAREVLGKVPGKPDA